MTVKMSTAKLGQEIVRYAPAWMDGKRIAIVEFPQNEDWAPAADFGQFDRKRGSEITLVRETKKITGFWIARIIGSNDTEQVANFSDAEFEILRRWHWTGHQWKEIEREAN